MTPTLYLPVLILAGASLAQIMVSVQDATNFCLLLPPNAGDNVGDTETTSLAKCSSPLTAASVNAPQFPAGFITSAHFISTPLYVQITGTIDRTKYSMQFDDQGGEYDSDPNGSRPGSTCQGYSSYFSFVGPAGNIFCIRCCNPGGDCDSSQDKAGCWVRIPGDYGPGFTNNRQAVAAVPGALSAAFALSTAISYSSSTMTTSLPLPTVSPRNNGSAIISNAVANGGSMIMMFALVSILIL